MEEGWRVAPGTTVDLAAIDSGSTAGSPGTKEAAARPVQDLRDRLGDWQGRLWAERRQALLARSFVFEGTFGDNPKLLAAVHRRIDAYRSFNGLSADVAVPVDAVTASGSGLDPDISVANAMDQVARVARARGLSPDRVRSLVRGRISERVWGFLGERTVNVLDLNLALDRLGPSG